MSNQSILASAIDALRSAIEAEEGNYDGLHDAEDSDNPETEPAWLTDARRVVAAAEAEQDQLPARLAALTAIVRELTEYQQEAFETDDEVDGGDAVDWLGQFREVAKGVLEEHGAPALFAVAVGSPFDGMWLRGPFLDHDSATEWGEVETDGESWPYTIVKIEPDPQPPPAGAQEH